MVSSPPADEESDKERVHLNSIEGGSRSGGQRQSSPSGNGSLSMEPLEVVEAFIEEVKTVF